MTRRMADIAALATVGPAAATATWGGWVDLGHMAGWGPIRPLPGTPWADATIDGAITLPLCVEALGIYALGALLSDRSPDRARRLARPVTIGALTLGALGQTTYHLLRATGRDRAPWPVVIAISVIPVLALAAVTALAHLRVSVATGRDGEEQALGEEGLVLAADATRPTTDDHEDVDRSGSGRDWSTPGSALTCTDEWIVPAPVVTDHDRTGDDPVTIRPVGDRSPDPRPVATGRDRDFQARRPAMAPDRDRSRPDIDDDDRIVARSRPVTQISRPTRAQALDIARRLLAEHDRGADLTERLAAMTGRAPTTARTILREAQATMSEENAADA